MILSAKITNLSAIFSIYRLLDKTQHFSPKKVADPPIRVTATFLIVNNLWITAVS